MFTLHPTNFICTDTFMTNSDEGHWGIGKGPIKQRPLWSLKDYFAPISWGQGNAQGESCHLYLMMPFSTFLTGSSVNPGAKRDDSNKLSGSFSPFCVASLCLTSWILQIFPSALTWEWLFLLEQSYLRAAEGMERQEGLALCALATGIQECQAIVVSIKIKFPNKKTSKGARKRQEETF